MDGMHGMSSDPKLTVIADPPDQHAFVMAGTQTLFLCHLTMLHMEPHMYQVVLRARLTDAAMRAYVNDSAAHPEATYFIGNRSDDLYSVPDLATGDRVEFIGTIWRGIPNRPVSEGWPWAGHDDLIVVDNVTVNVERVVHFRHFDFQLGEPETLTYLMFGSGGEAHLYHYQVKIPDFDSVVSLTSVPDWLSPRMLEAGMPVNFPDYPNKPANGAPIYCNHPISEGPHRVQMGGPRPATEDPSDPGPMTTGFTIQVGRTLWFNTKVTNFTDPCDGKGDGGGG
jgi:hypothetical protein